MNYKAIDEVIIIKKLPSVDYEIIFFSSFINMRFNLL